MTLGEAIVAAHQAGDVKERNRLMAYAHSHATLRDLQALLGCALASAHKWTREGEKEMPASWLDSAPPPSTLVTQQLCPRDAGTSGGVAKETQPPMQGPDYTGRPVSAHTNGEGEARRAT